MEKILCKGWENSFNIPLVDWKKLCRLKDKGALD